MCCWPGTRPARWPATRTWRTGARPRPTWGSCVAASCTSAGGRSTRSRTRTWTPPSRPTSRIDSGPAAAAPGWVSRPCHLVIGVFSAWRGTDILTVGDSPRTRQRRRRWRAWRGVAVRATLGGRDDQPDSGRGVPVAAPRAGPDPRRLPTAEHQGAAGQVPALARSVPGLAAELQRQLRRWAELPHRQQGPAGGVRPAAERRVPGLLRRGRRAQGLGEEGGEGRRRERAVPRLAGARAAVRPRGELVGLGAGAGQRRRVLAAGAGPDGGGVRARHRAAEGPAAGDARQRRGAGR